MYDLIIKNGEIIDGTGKASYFSNIGIKDGYIIEISEKINQDALLTIDAEKEIVCPGFIDIDSHSDFSLYLDSGAESKIRQGITTEIVGQGGRTLGPINTRRISELKQYTKSYVQNKDHKDYWNWKSQYEFIKRLEEKKISVNIASLVGYGTIRVAVMGFKDGPPSREEMNEMVALLTDELIHGIHGLSLGLDNSPDCLASMDELVEMAKIVKQYNGLCAIHMREEGTYLIESVMEAIEISRESGVKLQISHLKAAHPQNWGKVKEAIHLINKAKQSGLDIDYDVYPYVAYESVLSDVLPIWLREYSPEKIVETLSDKFFRKQIKDEMTDPVSTWGNPLLGSSWDQISISAMKKSISKRYVGLNINDISHLQRKDPIDTVIDLLIEEEGVIKIIFAAMIETDLEEVMKQSMAMYATDGLAISPKGIYKDIKVHPRYYGTFPRVLGRYVREKKIISIEDAIHKMTQLPAIKMNIEDRGLISEGFKADIVIFNKDEINDKATFQNPHQYSEGIKAVLVNGVVTFYKGVQTNALPGVVIRRT